jgi:hypothetical protein
MTATRTRYFHEDDYCQQEFLPMSAWEHCASQVREIDAFSDAHKMEYGWTDIYTRKPPPTALVDLGLTADEVAIAASPVLPPFTNVTTGYGSHVEPCSRIRAFGMEHGLTLFVESNTDGQVCALWLDPWGVQASEVSSVAELLSSLPKARELLFVDWAWSRLFQAADRNAWMPYFREHLGPIGGPA